jgi:anti-sigma B factor antagonist
MTFEYNFTKKDGINTYALKGELIDKLQSAELLQEIDTAITHNENKILLNLEDLKYINSSGLSVLINILTKSRKSGGEVAIFAVNKKITELLVITKLNSVFNVRSSAEEAIAVLKNAN